MRKSDIGRFLESRDNNTLRKDLANLNEVPRAAIEKVVTQVAEIYPCNILEVADAVASELGTRDGRALSDAAAAAMYILNFSERDDLKESVADLKDLGYVNDTSSKILLDLLEIGGKYRETAKAVDAYRTLGLPVFDDINGTVDLRFRFHRMRDELAAGVEPQEVVDIRPQIIVDIELRDDSRTDDRKISFQMDEHDLRTLKRFVHLMERELELVKPILRNAVSR